MSPSRATRHAVAGGRPPGPSAALDRRVLLPLLTDNADTRLSHRGASLPATIPQTLVMVEHHVRPSGEAWRVEPTPPAIETLVARLVALHPTLVVLDATGGWEVALVAALAP
jgi:hypothetical protein